MNRYGKNTQVEQITALIGVMTPGEHYTADDLAAKLGWSPSFTRMLIHTAEGTGAIWHHRASGKGRVQWVRRERKQEPAPLPWWQAGVLQGYDRQWRTFRDLCMLARAV